MPRILTGQTAPWDDEPLREGTEQGEGLSASAPAPIRGCGEAAGSPCSVLEWADRCLLHEVVMALHNMIGFNMCSKSSVDVNEFVTYTLSHAIDTIVEYRDNLERR